MEDFTISQTLRVSPAELGVFLLDNKIMEVSAEPNQKQITIKFPFENKSNETIEIIKHAAPCACLGAVFKDDKKIYAPDEKGELSVTFKLGNFFGTAEKQLLLWQTGDAKGKPSIHLTCKVSIPELFTISPRTLSWDLEGDVSTKICKLTVTHKEPIHVTNIVSTHDNFTYKLKTIRDGEEYELAITPRDTSTTSFGILKVTTDSSISRFKRTQAFVYVRRKAAP